MESVPYLTMQNQHISPLTVQQSISGRHVAVALYVANIDQVHGLLTKHMFLGCIDQQNPEYSE